MGYGVLLLSERLSKEAYMALLHETGTRHVVCSAQFNEAISGFEVDGNSARYRIVQSSEYALPTTCGPPLRSASIPKNVSNRIALILHSSGSTGRSKPVYSPHSKWLRQYPGVPGSKTFVSTPLYHGLAIATFFADMRGGNTFYLFKGGWRA